MEDIADPLRKPQLREDELFTIYLTALKTIRHERQDMINHHMSAKWNEAANSMRNF